MRAARVTTIGDLRVHEVEVRAPGPGELLVRIEACGVCGTDRHILHGEFPATFPLTIGHEFAGTVVEAGAETAIQPGTRVAVDPNIHCGICRDCRRGSVAYCSQLRALGRHSRRRNGRVYRRARHTSVHSAAEHAGGTRRPV